ncbi:MAG: conjugal transfer protein, partial [Alistipes sp.]|nr:conjugal transfer protein [Alistipes sp.]
MKKLLFLMGLSLAVPTGSFAQPRVMWRCDKVTQLIFPADIVKFRTGYTSDDTVSQSDGRVLYIQPI